MQTHVGRAQDVPREEGIGLVRGELPHVKSPHDLQLGGVLEQLAVASKVREILHALGRAVTQLLIFVGVLARHRDRERAWTGKVRVVDAGSAQGLGIKLRQPGVKGCVFCRSLERVWSGSRSGTDSFVCT